MGEVKQQQEKAARERLERELSLIRTAFDSASDAIRIADSAGRSVYQNYAFLTLFGYTVDELTKAGGPSALFADPAVAKDVFKRTRSGRSWNGEVMMRTRDGQLVPFALRVDRVVGSRGEAIGLMIVCTDVTASKRIEESLQDADGEQPDSLDYPRLVGISPAIQEITRMVEQAATSPLSYVLLTGERGVGKERVARAIHSATRCRGRFVGVNCATLTDTLFESLLFGHERGAFTGATGRVRGYAEQAADGTLLLDEIDALTPPQQAKLNRVLEEREYQPLGSEESHPLQARVIATSNNDLPAAARAGVFRADLYDRLAVFPIEVPPLRQHPEDVEALAEYFVAALSNKLKLQTRGLSEDAREKLRRCRSDWPGNIRSLRNVMERSLIRAQGGWVTANEITLNDAAAARPYCSSAEIEAGPSDPDKLILELVVGRLSPEEVSLRMAQQAMACTGGNQTAAADLLSISRFKLRRLLNAGVRNHLSG